jgi:predicted ATPase
LQITTVCNSFSRGFNTLIEIYIQVNTNVKKKTLKVHHKKLVRLRDLIQEWPFYHHLRTKRRNLYPRIRYFGS